MASAVGVSIISIQAFAKGLTQHEQTQLDTAHCAVFGENYSRNELSIRGMTGHDFWSEVYPTKNGYYVAVETTIWEGDLINPGPTIGFNCYRCPNNEMVVTKNTYEESCSN